MGLFGGASRFPNSVSFVPDGDTVLVMITVLTVVEHMSRRRTTNDLSSAYKYFK